MMEVAATELLPLSRSINSAFLPLTLRPRPLSSAFSSTTDIADHAAEQIGLRWIRIRKKDETGRGHATNVNEFART